MRLPREKLSKLKYQLKRAICHRSVPKEELKSLTSLLQFATKVVRSGRPFLRRLYALQAVGSQPDYLVRLNLPAQADVLWWFIFVEQWNGISLLWDLGLQTPSIKVHSDASGSWGCGTYSQSNWFQLQWTSRLTLPSIAVKELIPVVIAAATLGRSWGGQIAEFVVDNAAVVAVLNATFSRDCHLIHLIRLLVFFCCKISLLVCGFTHSRDQECGCRCTVKELLVCVFHSGASSRLPTRASTSSISASPITGHHLDLQELDQTVQRYFTAGLAPSSHKTYRAAECRYLDFCSSFALISLPTSEELLCYFSACLGQQGLAHKTIRTYLSGVR